MRLKPFALDRLTRLAANRLPGYLDACRACAVEATADALTFDVESECYAALSKYRKRFVRPALPVASDEEIEAMLEQDRRRGPCCDPPPKP